MNILLKFNGSKVTKVFTTLINNLVFATKKITQGNWKTHLSDSNTKKISDLNHSMEEMRIYLNKSVDRTRKELKEKNDIENALNKSTIVAVTDSEGIITHVNDAFVKISKYTKKELIGQNHRMLKSNYHPPEFYENMWKTITKGKIWRGEIKNRAKDGSYYWVQTGIVPVLENNGEIKQYISVRTDITKQKEAEQTLRTAYYSLEANEQKFKNLYEHSPNLFRTVNTSGIIRDCNEMYAKTLGYTKKEIINSSIFDYIPKEDLNEARKSFESWKKHGHQGGREITMIRKDGTTFPALITASEIYDEKKNLIGSNTSIVDLSEIKQAEKEIQKEKMKRLSAIGELSARIAHDLRNPLSVLKNTVELLEFDLRGNQNEGVKNKLDRITRAITRINHQVEDVLDFVRETPLKLESYSLNSILRFVIDRINVPSDITINLPKNDINIICDSEKLEIVFVNLITNAIQSMSNKGEITIKIKHDDNNYVIEVEDNGSGIPSDYLQNIFEPLFTTRQTGTGLGLPSCKTIVEAHKGKIEVMSTIGKGTIFRIKLPQIQDEMMLELKLQTSKVLKKLEEQIIKS